MFLILKLSLMAKIFISAIKRNFWEQQQHKKLKTMEVNEVFTWHYSLVAAETFRLKKSSHDILWYNHDSHP